jgi:hypothetical protein
LEGELCHKKIEIINELADMQNDCPKEKVAKIKKFFYQKEIRK